MFEEIEEKTKNVENSSFEIDKIWRRNSAAVQAEFQLSVQFWLRSDDGRLAGQNRRVRPAVLVRVAPSRVQRIQELAISFFRLNNIMCVFLYLARMD